MNPENAPYRQVVLEKAVVLTTKDRNKQHGDPHINLTQTAKLWSTYLGITVTAEQVANCNILQKISRTASSRIFNEDNYVDICGYGGIAGEMAMRDMAPENQKEYGTRELRCHLCGGQHPVNFHCAEMTPENQYKTTVWNGAPLPPEPFEEADLYLQSLTRNYADVPLGGVTKTSQEALDSLTEIALSANIENKEEFEKAQKLSKQVLELRQNAPVCLDCGYIHGGDEFHYTGAKIYRSKNIK